MRKKNLLLARIIVISIAFVLILASTTSVVAEQKAGLRIGIAISGWTTNPIFIDAGNILREQAKNDGHELIERSATADSLAGILEDFISSECDVIIVQGMWPHVLEVYLPQMEELGITIAVYDSDVFNEWECVAYSASCSNYEAGYFIGKAAAEWANANIEGETFAGVIDRPTSEIFKERGVGIIDAINENLNNGSVVSNIEGRGNEGGMLAAEDIISAHPECNLMVAWNGGSGVGAFEALKTAGWDGKTRALFTIDCSQDEVKALLEKNCLVGSLDLDLGEQFRMLFNKSINYVLDGKKYPDGIKEEDKYWYYPMQVVTQDNAADFLIASGN